MPTPINSTAQQHSDTRFPKTNRCALLLIHSVLILSLSACGGAEKRQEKYLQRAQDYFAENNFNKAKIEAKNVLQINPKNTHARFLMAQLYQEEGDFRQAYANFNGVVEEDPNYTDARIELAKILFAAKDNNGAREHIDLVMAQRPNDKDARILLAGLHSREKKPEQATSLAENVLEEFPGDIGAIAILAPLYALEDPNKALALIDTGLEGDHRNTLLKQLKIQILSAQGQAKDVEAILIELVNENPKLVNFAYRLARGYAFQNRLEDAEAVLHTAIKNNPDNLEAKTKLVEFTTQRLGFEQAATVVQQFIQDDPDSYKLQEMLAQLYMSAQRTEDAITLFNTIIEKQGSSAQALAARNALANLYLVQNDRQKAEQQLTEIFAIEPTNTDALIVNARLKLADQKHNEAIADLRAALKNDSESAVAYKLLAIAQERENLSSLALDNYLRVLTLDSRDISALIGAGRISLSQQKTEQAENYLNHAIEIDPSHEEALVLLTNLLSQQKRWQQAHQLLKPMLANDQSKAAGLLLKARLHRAQSQWPEAKQTYQQALALQPTAFEAFGGYTDSFLISKDYDGAIAFLTQHLKDHDNIPFAKDILATVYFKKGDTDRAKTLYQDLIQHMPERESAYQKLAAIHSQEKNLAEAEAVYQQGIAHNPEFSGLRVYLANHYKQQHDYQAAKQQYEKILEQRADFDLVKNNLAVLLLNYFPSEDNHKKALELASSLKDQKKPFYMDTLGWAHYHLGNIPQAISYLEAAISRQDGIEEFHYHLGMAYHKNGQLDKAKAALEIATQNSDRQYHGIDQAKATLATL